MTTIEVRDPIDQEARDRIAAARSETLFVEAGAGSGKTRELVQRIIGLVASGIPLPSIAAITFTNAAAAELRDRVRFELERASGRRADSPWDDHQRERCSEAVAAIDSASIQTLHSFAQRILSQYPIEAGLPPEFTVRDEVAASIAFEERWAPFLEDLLKDGRGDPAVAEAIVLGFGLGLESRHLEQVAEAFHQSWDRVLSAHFEQPSAPVVDAHDIIAQAEEVCARRTEITPGNESDSAYTVLSKLAPHVASMARAQAALDAAEAGDDRRAALQELLHVLASRPLSVSAGRQEQWPADVLRAIKARAKEAEQSRRVLLDGLRRACLGPLLGAIQGFVRDYRDERVRAGSLEFHDLLILARDLLRGNREVRQSLSNRYRVLLIDEFQDTDPIQIEIAVLLATDDSFAGTKPWQEIHVQPGRLFFVGDPKQSIYRFRRADIDLYRLAAERFGGTAGNLVRLTQNFRSVPSVIEWVNTVLGKLFDLERKQPPSGLASQVPFEALSAWREPDPESTVSVWLLGGPRDKGGEFGAIADLRRPEAQQIAGAIHRVRADGAKGNVWRVHDGANGWRAPRYSDIAVLMPTRTTLRELERALSEAGIPARVESRSLLFETEEVRCLLAILAAIDDPSDQVAVVAALRAPGFGCSDRDLYEFVAAGGRWDRLEDVPEGYPQDGMVAECIRSLMAFHRRRWWVDPAGMVDLVIRERRLFQVAFVSKRPRESWQRLRFLHEQARVFSSAGGRNLRQFVQFMERQGDENARILDTVVPEDDDDAVRIMTVHAAKGLEFPIVIMAGLNAKPGTQRPPLVWGAGLQPEIRVGKANYYFETAGYDGVRLFEESMDRIENDRLLYVAATRAKDHLIASVYYLVGSRHGRHGKQHSTNECTPAECLYSLSQDFPELWHELDPSSATPTPSVTTLPADGPATQEDFDSWWTARSALLEQEPNMPVVAATAIARAARARIASGSKDGAVPADADSKAEQLEEEAPWKRGRAGTSVGRAVHATLQTIDLATGEGQEATARAQAAAEGVEDRLKDILAFVEAARQSAAVREALSGGRFWREVYVSALVEGIAVEGFVDLLYETPGGLVVVDYKTDTVTGLTIDAAAEAYRLQGAAYALALETSLHRRVARCTFVFVQPRAERDIVDLPQAMEEVRALLPEALKPSNGSV